jgi:hypothetical protein
MYWVLFATIEASVALAAILQSTSARAQAAGQYSPSEILILPADLVYPDAVTCDVKSPDGISYRMIFYKGQTVSFATQPNNAAEYGTTFIRDPDKFDASIAHKWRLQLGRPGNITVFTIPARWTNENCPVGKTIERLRADKQLMKLFTLQ